MAADRGGREASLRVVSESFFPQRLECAKLLFGRDTETVEREGVLEPGEVDKDEKTHAQLGGCDKMLVVGRSVLCHVGCLVGVPGLCQYVRQSRVSGRSLFNVAALSRCGQSETAGLD